MDADAFKQRAPCFHCERKFALDALERHEKICEKTSQKKRKQFDSAKQRTADGDNMNKAEPAKPEPKQPIRVKQKMQTKTAQPTQRTSRPSTVPSRLIAPSNDCVPCPHCDRNFGSKSADRHIKWCGEQKARIPRSPTNYTAKNRLSARIQYKAPLPGKKCSLPNLRTSPKKPHSVSVTGKAITQAPSLFVDAASHTVSPCGSVSGTSSSSGWEWEDKALATATNNPAKKECYDPYLAAKKQMQQLRNTVHPQLPRGGTTPTDCDPFYVEDDRRGSEGKTKALQRRRANREFKRQKSRENDDNNNSRLSNVSQDSDYFSLFQRRSPNSKSRTPSPTRLLSLSQSPQMEFLVGNTSDSESSVQSVVSRSSISPKASNCPLVKLPKFCHECGSQYPVRSAKYCCECGVRRLFV